MTSLRPEDLDKIAGRMKKAMSLREGGGRAKVTVHMGTCGISAGARKILSTVMSLVNEGNISDVIVTTSGCAGLCSREPMMTVELTDQAPVKYVDLTEDKAKEIFKEHILGENVVTEYALAMGSEQVL